MFILYPLLCLILIGCKSNESGKFVTSVAQFLNPGFEEGSRTNLIKNWEIGSTKGYAIGQVRDVKHSGASSLKIEGKPNNATAYINVKQKLDIVYDQIKRIKIDAYIKTKELKGNVVLWYQIWDVKKRQISFGNSESLGVMPTGTKEWQKYTIEFIADKNAKKNSFWCIHKRNWNSLVGRCQN